MSEFTVVYIQCFETVSFSDVLSCGTVAFALLSCLGNLVLLDALNSVIHYKTKGMWIPAHRTSHSKIMGINMELVPLCCYNSCPVLCARGHCHAKIGMGLPQNVATKLEAQNRLECHCML